MSAASDPALVLERARTALGTAAAASSLLDLERAAAAAPGNPRLWQMKALVERDLDDRLASIASFDRALALAPADARIAHGLARTRLEAGLPALDAYGRALQLAPGDPEIILGLTGALIAENEVPAAIRGLEQIIARSPLWIEGHQTLSDLRWLEGERASFTRSFDDALAAQPLSIELRREQLVALLHAEQYDEALAAIARGRAAMGDQPQLDLSEAIVRSERGETEAADRLFAPFAELDDSAAQIRRVRHFLRSGRPELASRLIDRWLGTADEMFFYPYASVAWRMTRDPRWAWLEGDPAFVGVYDIADRLPPLDQLAATLRRLHTTSGHPLQQSLRGGTQTDGNLFFHVDPVLVSLREAIRGAVAEHVAALPPREPGHPLLGPARGPIGFSGAWSVRLQAGGNHINHVHPMGWLSSALYIVLPPDVGREEAGVLALGEPPEPLRLDLAPVRTVEPRVGRLALFPSTMWHGTRPFAEGERMTVAFDVAIPR